MKNQFIFAKLISNQHFDIITTFRVKRFICNTD